MNQANVQKTANLEAEFHCRKIGANNGFVNSRRFHAEVKILLRIFSDMLFGGRMDESGSDGRYKKKDTSGIEAVVENLSIHSYTQLTLAFGRIGNDVSTVDVIREKRGPLNVVGKQSLKFFRVEAFLVKNGDGQRIAAILDFTTHSSGLQARVDVEHGFQLEFRDGRASFTLVT